MNHNERRTELVNDFFPEHLSCFHSVCLGEKGRAKGVIPKKLDPAAIRSVRLRIFPRG